MGIGSFSTTESTTVKRRIAGHIMIIRVYHGQSSVMSRRLLCAGLFDTDDRLNQEAGETQIGRRGTTRMPIHPGNKQRRQHFRENRKGLSHQGGLGQNHACHARTHSVPTLEPTTGTHPMPPTMGSFHHPGHVRHHPAHDRHVRTTVIGSRLQRPQPHERKPCRQQHPGRTTGRSGHGRLWVLGTGNHSRRAMGRPSRQKRQIMAPGPIQARRRTATVSGALDRSAAGHYGRGPAEGRQRRRARSDRPKRHTTGRGAWWQAS